jgi:DNA (cytosine-5)-methyltransferase 1
MAAYYNENDSYCAQWLRNLIAAGHIAAGDVDNRDIRDVRADDLRGYAQCHFFAGIGGWSYALRLAGWPDDRPVWTGSCPCQPLSAAGKGLGTRDERHLWPEWFRLIAELRPVAIFGEQVASKDGLAWLDIVQADLEKKSYASGTVDFCAAGVGAPHIRQRLWFVANADGGNSGAEGLQRSREYGFVPQDGGFGELADADMQRTPKQGHRQEITRWSPDGSFRNSEIGKLADAESQYYGSGKPGSRGRAEPANGGATFWSDAEWIACADGKVRPVEPGTFPLAYGIPGRMGRLRAYGNAIVPQVAAEFICAAAL